jgi:hypothetical protein
MTNGQAPRDGNKSHDSDELQATVVVVIVWELELQLPMQSVSITTDVVSSNLDQGVVYNVMW